MTGPKTSAHVFSSDQCIASSGDDLDAWLIAGDTPPR